MLNRHAIGMDINKLGWLYSTVKLYPATKESVIQRLHEIYELILTKYYNHYQSYNEFLQSSANARSIKFFNSSKRRIKLEIKSH